MTAVTVVAAICAIAFVVSAGVSELVRRYALRSGIVDVPSDRSSHETPTPRGGGMGPLVAFIVGAIALTAAGVTIPRSPLLALVGGAVAVGVIGWIDDHRSLSPLTRLLVHASAAAWLVAASGAPLPVLVAVAVVWVVNLYNFMDGIDGLAAGQAVVVAGGGALLAGTNGDPGLAGLYLVLSASAAGLLVWNWPPARLFMGDVGSGALGFILAGLGLAGALRGSVPWEAWLLLMAVFVVDATATLLRRAVQGEAWYRPHRSHAYQRAVQRGWSHGRVTLTILSMDVTLVALAWVVARDPVGRVAALIGVYALLLVLWWRLANRANEVEAV